MNKELKDFLEKIGMMLLMFIGYTLAAFLFMPIFKLKVLQEPICALKLNQVEFIAYAQTLSAIWILIMISYTFSNYKKK